MSLSLEDILAIIEKAQTSPSGVPITLVLNVTVGETASLDTTDGGDDVVDDGLVSYRVDTTNKNNNRVKIRPEPDNVAEIGYVFHGDVVKGDGYEFNSFARISEPMDGYVELEYLVRL